MAEFPRYQSKGALTTQAPAALQQTADTTGEIMGNIGKVGQVAEESMMKWAHAVNTIQKTTSQANFETRALDAKQRYQETLLAKPDADIKDYNSALQEIEKIKNESLTGFTNKGAESEMKALLDYKAKTVGIEFQNLYKKKMIDVGQTSSLKLIDAQVANPNDSSLPVIRAELAKQVQAGIFDQKDAYILERKANDDLGVNRINKDLYQAQTPEQVDDVTQRITSGAYEQGGVTIEPDKKKNLLDIAERARTNVEKRLQAQAVEAQTQNRVSTLTGLASGQVPIESVNIKDIAEYDPQLASTLTKVKDFVKNYNPKLPPNEQGLSSAGLVSPQEIMRMKSYARSITDVFMQNDNQKLGDFVLRELDKKSDGLTPSIKIAAFANLAALKAKANNPQTPEDAAAAVRLNAIDYGVKFLQSSNPYLFNKTVGDFLVNNFLSGAASNEKVMSEAKGALKKEILSRYVVLAKLPSLPNKIVDGNAPVEDIQSGENNLKEGDANSGEYADQPAE